LGTKAVGWGEDQHEAVGVNGYPRPGVQTIEGFKWRLAPPGDAN
jgi:hypothetical protein